MTTVLLAGGGTGGHLMPALAIADAIATQHPEWRLLFAGAERGIEAKVLPERGLAHQLFPFEPIHRRAWWRNAKWPLLAVRVIRAVDAMLKAERPDLVIGTGGYVSGPVVWRAARRGIPTAILELDVRPGMATRMLASRVDEVWLAVPEAKRGLPGSVRGDVVVTGAPIVPPDPSRRAAALAGFSLRADRPVVVVTGGSQGSRAINQLIAEWVKAGGASGAQLIWATGRLTHQEFVHLHAPPDVTIVPFLDPMADAWALADLCVARAGMMTLSELCAWGIPSILIPLPTAAQDHQTPNAEAMAAAGAAIALRQEGLTAEALGRQLTELLQNESRRMAMAAAARARGQADGAARIASRVEALIAGAAGGSSRAG